MVTCCLKENNNKIKCDCYTWHFWRMWSEHLVAPPQERNSSAPCVVGGGRSRQVCTSLPANHTPRLSHSKIDWKRSFRRMRQDSRPTLVCVCVCVCNVRAFSRCREQGGGSDVSELLLLDYVKHSHSPEVTAPLWKLKASQRSAAFVSGRLSHPLASPAPTRYTPHGRLLRTTERHIRRPECLLVCTGEGGREGWAEGNGRGGWGRGGALVAIQIGTDWWDSGSVRPASLLPGF